MPMLTDLALALREGGLGVWESSGWQTRAQRDSSGRPIPMADIRAIMIHHTAGGGASDWLTVQNGRPDLRGPLAHLTHERDGGVRVLAAGQCWHAGTGSHPLVGRNNGNAHCIGIEGVSPGVGPNAWTVAQRRYYPRVAAALCRWYRLPAAAVIFHKEWAPGRKIDAGEWDPNAFRAEVADILRGSFPTPLPRPYVAPPTARRRREEDDDMQLPAINAPRDFQIPTDVVGGWCGKAGLILTANTDGNAGSAKVFRVGAVVNRGATPPDVRWLAEYPGGKTFTQWWGDRFPLPTGTWSVIVNYVAPAGMVARVEYEH